MFPYLLTVLLPFPVTRMSLDFLPMVKEEAILQRHFDKTLKKSSGKKSILLHNLTEAGEETIAPEICSTFILHVFFYLATTSCFRLLPPFPPEFHLQCMCCISIMLKIMQILQVVPLHWCKRKTTGLKVKLKL